MRDLSHINSEPTKKSYKLTHTYSLNLGLLISTGILVITYIFIANNLATMNLSIRKLNSQIADLEATHKQLDLQNSSLQSMASIQQVSQQLNFVPVTNVSYIKSDNFALK
jgi:energy-coupling factor transporter transmembrane protein EcfT